MRRKLSASPLLLPILAGFLIGTSYIPFPPWALFFCLTPLFLSWVNAKTAKQAFLSGWITQFILNLIGFHWIAYTAVEFGHFPWWGGVLTLIGFAAIAHLYYPISGWLAWRLAHRVNAGPLGQVAVFALTFALMDRIFPMIFPWHLGYPWLWAGLPGSQFSDVIGFEGLNVLTIAANALFAAAYIVWKQGQKRSARIMALASVAAVLLVNVAGLGRSRPWEQTDSEVRILTVQGNIGNFDKLKSEHDRDFGFVVLRKYIELSKRGLSEHPTTQLMLWPETAFPGTLDSFSVTYPLSMQLRSFVQESKTPLLTGSYSYEPAKDHSFNALFYLPAQGAPQPHPYRKSILLVFGETFPFSEYLPYMDKFFPNQGSFARGPGPSVMELALENTILKVGAQICYEGLYPWFSRELSLKGAQVIVNVTNDSWFGRPFEPHQHGTMTLARAVELRRPLIRSTNTGISTVILASGEVLERSPLHQPWYGLYSVRYHSQPTQTIYARFGWLWPWLLAAALALVLIWLRTRMKTARG